MDDTALSAEVERYLDYLRVERRHAEGTAINYARALGQLREHAQKLGIGRWRELKSDQVRAWLAQEHCRGLSPGTLHHMLSACRSFFNYLAREGTLKINPAAGVHSPGAAAQVA